VGFSNIIIIGRSQIISKIHEVIGDGKKYNVNINFIEETKELGTAKTLELAKKHLTHDFLWMPCDSFFNFDLEKLWNFHNSYKGVITMGIHTRTSYEWKRGIVEMDGYYITSYEENPKKPKTKLSGSFVGFMKPGVFNKIPPGEVYWSLQENVFPQLAKERKLIGYPISGDWVNIHSEKDVENLSEIIKRQK
jgi:NDP-sugar pyrophosphorylase family protein